MLECLLRCITLEKGSVNRVRLEGIHYVILRSATLMEVALHSCPTGLQVAGRRPDRPKIEPLAHGNLKTCPAGDREL
jgi:hypothetical protein